jgi:hypothetical protein
MTTSVTSVSTIFTILTRQATSSGHESDKAHLTCAHLAVCQHLQARNSSRGAGGQQCMRLTQLKVQVQPTQHTDAWRTWLQTMLQHSPLAAHRGLNPLSRFRWVHIETLVDSTRVYRLASTVCTMH